jgi:hypothetical protein
MPNSLTGSKAKLTYQELLHVSGGVDGTLKTVYDGDGTALPLKVSNNQVSVTSSSSSDAFKVTQTGTGNAFVVEDSASPDSSAFVIDANGSVGIGTSSLTAINLSLSKSITGASTAYNQFNNSTIQSDVITNAYGIFQKLNTASATFTVANANAFYAEGITIGANSSVTNAFGFRVPSNFTTATNGNFAFHSNLPVNALKNWAFYGSGTAPSFFGGNICIGSTNSTATRTVEISRNITGGTSANSIFNESAVSSDVTTLAEYYSTSANTQAATFTLGGLNHFRAGQATFGAGSSVTSQYGFRATATLIGATNNYAFFAEIPSGTNRWNFYASGTANNYFAGSVGIGNTSLTGYNLLVFKNITGATSSSGVGSLGNVQSDVTNTANGYTTSIGTQATAFTLSNLIHYSANQGTIGAGSTVTNQIGFRAVSSLVGATNNYGFYGDIASGTGRWNFYSAGTADNYFAGNLYRGSVNVAQPVNGNASISITNTGTTSATSGYAGILNSTTAAISSTVYLGKQNSTTAADNTAAVTAGHYLGRVSFGGSDTAALVEGASIRAIADGTWSTTSRPTYLHFNTTPAASITPIEAARIGSDGIFFKYQPDPAAQNTATTLTTAQLAAGIITTAPAGAIALTLPTGTSMEAISNSLPVNSAFEVTVINTSASVVTMTANTGHTIVGVATVAATTSATFRFRKTATNTFVAYRV